jgi:hypothetical protein
MSVVIIAIVAVLLVLGVGMLVLLLMRRSQKVVPQIADGGQTGERVVGADAEGRQITEAEEPAPPARDDASFESLLQDEIRSQGREEPTADDQT